MKPIRIWLQRCANHLTFSCHRRRRSRKLISGLTHKCTRRKNLKLHKDNNEDFDFYVRIGLERNKVNSEEWDWINDMTDSWYRNWGSGKSNNDRSNNVILQNCVIIYLSKKGPTKHGWTDTYCDKPHDHRTWFVFCRYYNWTTVRYNTYHKGTYSIVL